MGKSLVLWVVLCVLLTSAAVVFAQNDDSGIVPGTPADNLCNEGGAWDDGRCDIPNPDGAKNQAWKCGWYMARYYDGIFTADQVIEPCQHYLNQPEPVEEEEYDPCRGFPGKVSSSFSIGKPFNAYAFKLMGVEPRLITPRLSC